MSFGTALEVAIGLALVFLVFSLLVSGIHEAVARIFSWRAKTLWAAIRRLVDSPPPADAKVRTRLRHVAAEGDVRPTATSTTAGTAGSERLTPRLYAHPLIGGLEDVVDDAKTRIDHIAPSSFARALVDVLVPDGNGETSVEKVREKVQALPETHPLRKQLLILVSEAGEGLDSLRGKVETWFDTQMAALTRGYRRRSKWFMLVFGMIVAFGCNVDAIAVTRRLYDDDVLRAAFVSEAESVADACEDKTGDDLTTCLRDETEPLEDELPIPVGWKDFDFKATALLGWPLAGFALMQGAPFWFDLLNRAVALRRKRAPDTA